MIRACVLVLMLSAAPGCPREPQDPEPGEGRPCASLADCNMGAVCGEAELFACVDGLCELSPSLIRPCPGGGARPDAGM